MLLKYLSLQTVSKYGERHKLNAIDLQLAFPANTSYWVRGAFLPKETYKKVNNQHLLCVDV